MVSLWLWRTYCHCDVTLLDGIGHPKLVGFSCQDSPVSIFVCKIHKSTDISIIYEYSLWSLCILQNNACVCIYFYTFVYAYQAPWDPKRTTRRAARAPWDFGDLDVQRWDKRETLAGPWAPSAWDEAPNEFGWLARMTRMTWLSLCMKCIVTVRIPYLQHLQHLHSWESTN